MWFGTLQDKEQKEDKSNGLDENMDYRKVNECHWYLKLATAKGAWNAMTPGS